jgi:hypothetical protein
MSDIISADHQGQQSKDMIEQMYQRSPGPHTPSLGPARYVSPDDYNEAPGGLADRSPRTALTQATQSVSRLEQSTRTRVVVAPPAWPDWIVLSLSWATALVRTGGWMRMALSRTAAAEAGDQTGNTLSPIAVCGALASL